MLTTKEAQSSGRSLSSVGSALRLLKVFSAEEPEWGITALSKHLGIAKSTVHRLASTLVAEGFLERNPSDGRYRLGLLLFSMGTLVRRRMDFAEEAVPMLRDLCESTGETVHLAVLDGNEILYLRNIESRHAIRPRSYLGVRKPALCTSEGRALLAFSPPVILGSVLRARVEQRTDFTITDKAQLSSLLDTVRKNGFAYDDQESEIGMRGIAAPIFDASGAAVAAVGIAGPIQRLTKPKIRKFTALTTAAAHAISQRLGYADREFYDA